MKTGLSGMQENNVDITFQSVAKYAGVSKAWSYSNKEIAAEIREKRSTNTKIKRSLDQDSLIAKKNKQIEVLEKRIAVMSSEIESLKLQLEAAYAESYKLL